MKMPNYYYMVIPYTTTFITFNYMGKTIINFFIFIETIFISWLDWHTVYKLSQMRQMYKNTALNLMLYG